MEAQFFFSQKVRSKTRKVLRAGVLSLLMIGLKAQAENPQYKRYFFDTYRSLACLRAPSGLIHDKRIYDKEEFSLDKAFCGLRFLNEDTSPTNIGLDILIQVEATAWPELRSEALSTLQLIFQVLEKTPYDSSSGLFFSRYLTGDEPAIMARDISSVDNIHLALAFWTVAEQFSGTDLGTQARKFFNRMDFSLLYDSTSGLMYGGMTWQDGHWVTSGWTYRFFGSESRSISSLGWSLGLFKDDHFLEKFFTSAEFEFFQWPSGSGVDPILRTWDGGAFQLLLPEMLIQESGYSSALLRSFRNFAKYIVQEGQSRSLPVPAAHSACEYGVSEASLCPWAGACYSGKAGNLDLVSEKNADRNDGFLRSQWQSVYTSHAALMASVFDLPTYSALFRDLENKGRDGYYLYTSNLGWMDGLILEGPFSGKVIHVLLSLDQGMAALAMARVLSKDQQTSSARALQKNFQARKKLQVFYDHVDQIFLRQKSFEKFSAPSN